MDRVHRIGQTKVTYTDCRFVCRSNPLVLTLRAWYKTSKAVNVYRLITQNTIEEKIMKLQETKMAMSKAIVNSENSTMYSMGTDRLLDIFTFRSNDNDKKSGGELPSNLGALDETYSEGDYVSLSVQEFIGGFHSVSES
jgi:(2Fe-2S) ferredoxin